jgi:hypothetical protein
MPVGRRGGAVIERVGLREMASIASIGLAVACAFAAWDYVVAFDPLPARLGELRIAFLPFVYMAGIHFVCFGLLAPLFVIGPAQRAPA